MEDFTSGHISTEEAAEIIRDLGRELGGDGIEFFPGVSYRHLMVWRDGKEKMETTPPHDITDQKTAGYLAQRRRRRALAQLMDASQPILAAHPVNKKREAEGQRQATTIWLWGQGRAPQLPPLTERFGITGGVISAVDIIHGLGVYAGLERIDVPGITGFLDTNYIGKGEYGVRSLEKNDLVFIHVEATDEAGHMGDVESKNPSAGRLRRKSRRHGAERHGASKGLSDSFDARPSDRHRAQDPCFRSGAVRVVFAAETRANNGAVGYNEKDAREDRHRRQKSLSA